MVIKKSRERLDRDPAVTVGGSKTCIQPAFS